MSKINIKYFVNGLYNISQNGWIYNVKSKTRVKRSKQLIVNDIFQFLMKDPTNIIKTMDLINCFDFMYNNYRLQDDDYIDSCIPDICKTTFTELVVQISFKNDFSKLYICHIETGFNVYVDGTQTVNYIIRKLKEKGMNNVKLYDEGKELQKSDIISKIFGTRYEVILKTSIKYEKLLDKVDTTTTSKILGSIYLLQEGRYIETNKQIYKIGKTSRCINERLKGYPKGGYLFMVLGVDIEYLDVIETNLKNLFKEKFIQKKEEAGEEYFEGDVDMMKDEMYDYIKNKKYLS